MELARACAILKCSHELICARVGSCAKTFAVAGETCVSTVYDTPPVPDVSFAATNPLDVAQVTMLDADCDRIAAAPSSATNGEVRGALPELFGGSR